MPIYRTAESVSPGHPDKICDQISDAILDAHLAEDPNARVAIDVAGGHGTVFVTGEVTSKARHVDVDAIVKRLAGDVKVIEHIAAQSPEIARGVDTGGAGDQGIMVGYATSETPELLPLEVVLARRLNQYLYKKWPFDGKTQVTLRDGKVASIVASFQNASTAELKAAVEAWLLSISAVGTGATRRLQGEERSLEFTSKDPAEGQAPPEIFINPAGDWQQGGFDADAGLTGRKLIVDNYGPRVPIGGGAFSGKDPSKVDRSAAYAARKIAIDYLGKRQAREVFVYLAYAIGYDQPLEATVVIDGKSEQVRGYDLSPDGIIELLGLKRPIYEATARYGHFGHADFPWEQR